MDLTYIRRYRMRVDFADVWLPPARLPQGYEWVPWSRSLIDRHAAVKYLAFESEIDAQVFPCLGRRSGCRRLMAEIARQKSFLSHVTWLVAYRDCETHRIADCATIQGMRKRFRTGSIHNVGVVPAHRGIGLGRAILLKALHGFRDARMKRVILQVTADNTPAVALYRSLGFRVIRTMYNSIVEEPVYSF